VFQAGHCDWHRPHSVQVVKSSSPFQVNCSTAANAELVALRVGVLESSGLPALIIGRRPPSAGRVDAVRLKKMLKKTGTGARPRPW